MINTASRDVIIIIYYHVLTSSSSYAIPENARAKLYSAYPIVVYRGFQPPTTTTTTTITMTMMITTTVTMTIMITIKTTTTTTTMVTLVITRESLIILGERAPRRRFNDNAEREADPGRRGARPGVCGNITFATPALIPRNVASYTYYTYTVTTVVIV